MFSNSNSRSSETNLHRIIEVPPELPTTSKTTEVSEVILKLFKILAQPPVSHRLRLCFNSNFKEKRRYFTRQKILMPEDKTSTISTLWRLQRKRKQHIRHPFNIHLLSRLTLENLIKQLTPSRLEPQAVPALAVTFQSTLELPVMLGLTILRNSILHQPALIFLNLQVITKTFWEVWWRNMKNRIRLNSSKSCKTSLVNLALPWIHRFWQVMLIVSTLSSILFLKHLKLKLTKEVG